MVYELFKSDLCTHICTQKIVLPLYFWADFNYGIRKQFLQELSHSTELGILDL